MMKEPLFLRAAKGEVTERPPVWMMRQAGRVLPEYRELRASVSGFKELVKTPDLAAEVTLQPIRRFGVDAAIIFSDILVIPEAMGLPYEMEEGRGPMFPKTIQQPSDIDKLTTDVLGELEYVDGAIRKTVAQLDEEVPLIGFAGAPWTIFCYMTEGQGSKTFSVAKRLLYQDPKAAHKLMDKITQATIVYLKAQIKAGASLVQVFDSWAGILGPEQYRHFAVPALKTICEEIQEVPITLFSKGAWFALGDLNALDCSAISLDWSTTPSFARQCVPNKTLQGNLDPCALYGDEESIVQATKAMLHSFAGKPHIANLGHGLYPDLDFRKVQVFVDTVKQA